MCVTDFRNEGSLDLEFMWRGKKHAAQLADAPAEYKLVYNNSLSHVGHRQQHQFIIGENLDALKALLPIYKDRINQIYIDPPYNTGKQFVYRDSFSSKSDWLNMIYPRLKVARELLTKDGVIFVSIDDHQLSSLKLILDEIFGSENYIEIFSWVKSATPANLSKKSKKVVEYILCYEKNKSSRKYKGIKKTSPSSNGLLNQTNAVGTLVFPPFKVMTNIENRTIPAGKYGTDKYAIELLESTEVENRIFIKPIQLNGKFKWSQKKLDEEIAKGTKIAIPTIKFSPSYDKLNYDPEVPPNLIDYKVGVTTNEVASENLRKLIGPNIFEYPKPVSLIKYLLGFTGSKKDIVLDFFAGSATTMQAVMELNSDDRGKRTCICIQSPEPIKIGSKANQAGYHHIAEIGLERIKQFQAMKYPLGHQPDEGVEVYNLEQ